MFSTSKIKWFGSIVLAGCLLTLALMGGNWGTTYPANASVAAVPVITSIDPSKVPAGSADTIVIISGSNFGNMDTTRVRLTNTDTDLLLKPLQVLPNEGVSVNITDTLLVSPTLYIVTVIKSEPGSIPTLPIVPPYDLISNPLPFFVYGASNILLPIITNNAIH
jgi:hypothetical protein